MTLSITLRPLALALALLSGVFSGGPARAHGDEDHGAPAAAMTQAMLPRASAATDDFELVAVLESTRLLIYLDRMASNEPVPKARVEVEGAGPAALAAEVGPGVYALDLARPLAAGAHALTFTVQAGDTGDLLTAALQVPSDAAPAPAAPAPASRGPLWIWLAGGAALAGASLVWLALRRRRNPT